MAFISTYAPLIIIGLLVLCAFFLFAIWMLASSLHDRATEIKEVMQDVRQLLCRVHRDDPEIGEAYKKLKG